MSQTAVPKRKIQNSAEPQALRPEKESPSERAERAYERVKQTVTVNGQLKEMGIAITITGFGNKRSGSR